MEHLLMEKKLVSFQIPYCIIDILWWNWVVNILDYYMIEFFPALLLAEIHYSRNGKKLYNIDMTIQVNSKTAVVREASL